MSALPLDPDDALRLLTVAAKRHATDMELALLLSRIGASYERLYSALAAAVGRIATLEAELTARPRLVVHVGGRHVVE